MRKWKDEIPSQMKELNKASIIFLSATNAFTIAWIIVSGQINGLQIFGIVSSVILIYLMRTGKIYKMIKSYIEWRLKKRDNKWR